MNSNTSSAIASNAPVFNATEAEERSYHKQMTKVIGGELKKVHQNVVSRHGEMMEIKQQLQEHSRDLDHADKANLRQAADMASRVGEHAIERRRKLARLLESPYFGRIDFQPEGKESSEPVYIGVYSFSDDGRGHSVHDWRAPVASMFYDYELGEASYEAPSGKIDGFIRLKRQFRIEKQQFRFMLESSLNIQDDILQEELSRASDDKLKNIVATIQRDQNAIIRNDDAHTLIIQGAAGSGKTSIALHRIAFLLYKYKDTISSDEILIISPNKVFAHYVSQVLPELGEDMIQETTMESLADELLDGNYKFQTFAEQVSTLLGKRNPEFEERVRFKATPEFLEQLDRYIHHVQSTRLQTAHLKVGFYTIDGNWIASQFRRRSRFPVNEQLNGVVSAVVEYMQLEHQKSVVGKERSRIRGELRAMLSETNLKTIYKNFYTWLGRPEMFKPAAKGALEYADVFPLVYLKLMLDSVSPRNEIKHVVVDEMQDYTPVQYQVLAHLYPCKKTVLGDRNQSVNPLSASSAESIQAVLPKSGCAYMNKSYRSSYEITEVAQAIVHNPDLAPIERHGEKPQLRKFRTKRQELDFLVEAVRGFSDSDFNSMGVICKTQRQADKLYEVLRDEADVRLLDAESKTFSGGVMISTAYLAKGLEFDQVLVPFCNDTEYQSSIDRHMLYVAVTRAMHVLAMTHTGNVSPFLRSLSTVGGDQPYKRS